MSLRDEENIPCDNRWSAIEVCDQHLGKGCPAAVLIPEQASVVRVVDDPVIRIDRTEVRVLEFRSSETIARVSGQRKCRIAEANAIAVPIVEVLDRVMVGDVVRGKREIEIVGAISAIQSVV